MQTVFYFLPGQYFFKRVEDGRESAKALSSEQIARAFRDFQIDMGWLERSVLHYREEPEANLFLSYEPARIRRFFVERSAGEISGFGLRGEIACRQERGWQLRLSRMSAANSQAKSVSAKTKSRKLAPGRLKPFGI